MSKIQVEVLYLHETVFRGNNIVSSKIVEGYPFNKHGIKGAIHEDIYIPKMWSLTDINSGHRIINSKRKKDIENRLLELIEEKGQNRFYKVLNNAKSLEQTKKDGFDQHGNDYISQEEIEKESE